MTNPLQTRHTRLATFDHVDEARAVLERLERIEELEHRGAPPTQLLGEVRALLRAAEAWVRVEGDERAVEAVERCRDSLASTTIAV